MDVRVSVRAGQRRRRSIINTYVHVYTVYTVYMFTILPVPVYRMYVVALG